MVPSTVASALTRARRLGRYAGRWARHHLGLDSPGLVYVIDNFGWALGEIGVYLRAHALRAGFERFELTDEGRAHYGRVVHFASQYFVNQDLHVTTSASNRLVFTWLHGDPQDADRATAELFRRLPEAVARADRIVTSTDGAADQLIRAGCPPDKIIKIPLGVELARFRPAAPDERRRRRADLGIPEHAFVVGSFQKDGVGWGEGLEPKRVKGPDVFVDALVRFRATRPGVHALLLGPARGYVKTELTRHGIPFTHRVVERLDDTAPYYDALDAYLIASRTEGGPLALMESMAKQVPVVSTRMGMPAELLADGTCGLLAEIEDARGLADQLGVIAEDVARRDAMTKAALARVQSYGWEQLTQRYLSEVWRPLLDTLS